MILPIASSHRPGNCPLIKFLHSVCYGPTQPSFILHNSHGWDFPQVASDILREGPSFFMDVPSVELLARIGEIRPLDTL